MYMVTRLTARKMLILNIKRSVEPETHAKREYFYNLFIIRCVWPFLLFLLHDYNDVHIAAHTLNFMRVINHMFVYLSCKTHRSQRLQGVAPVWCWYSLGLWLNTPNIWGTRWRSWLRHCATSRKVAGSVPDGVIGIFHWHNPSCCTMALGSTQPLTEIGTRNISWG